MRLPWQAPHNVAAATLTEGTRPARGKTDAGAQNHLFERFGRCIKKPTLDLRELAEPIQSLTR